ncbi:MAG: flagellar hook-basal body complex protein FliE [Paracoccaceae bacterium]
MAIETALATGAYDAARATAAPRGPAQGASFSEALAEAARALGASVAEGEAAAQVAVAGSGELQRVVEALSATELAMETAVTVRDRVVEAYQEILRMPV